MAISILLREHTTGSSKSCQPDTGALPPPTTTNNPFLVRI